MNPAERPSVQARTQTETFKTIKQILVNIKQSLKNIRVKISVFLSKLDELLFLRQRPKLSAEEMTLILIGVYDEQVPGVVTLCGIKSKVTSKLKKSSFYAIGFLLRLFEEHPQKKEFIQIFTQFEDEEFKQLRLNLHILNEKSSKSALKVAGIIKQNRPHLEIDDYIEGKKAQERFEKWYIQFQAENAQEIQIQVSVPVDADADEQFVPRPSSATLSTMRREEKNKNRRKQAEIMYLKNFTKNIEYFKATISDPLQIYMRQSQISMKKSIKPTAQKSRKTAEIKSIVNQVLYPKTEVIDVESRLQQSAKSNLDELIERIHIDSSGFDPITFLNTLHFDTPEQELHVALENLQQQRQVQSNLSQILIFQYFDDFFGVENAIKKTQNSFIAVELAQKDNSFMFKISNNLLRINGDLLVLQNKLNEQNSDTDVLRQILQLLQKNHNLVRLPHQLKKLHNKNDFVSIVRLYQEHLPYIRKYEEYDIFYQLLQDINKIILLVSNSIQVQIEQNLKLQHKINEYVILLLDLGQRGQNPIEQLIHRISKKILDLITQNLITETHNQDIELLEEGADARTADKPADTSSPARKPLDTSQLVNEIITSNYEGDLLHQFLQENGLSFKTSSNYQMDSKALMNFFSEIIPQINNFYTLCNSYQNGDYDFKLQQYGEIKQEDRISLIRHTFHEIFRVIIEGFKQYIARLSASINAPPSFRAAASASADDDMKKFIGKYKKDLQVLSSIFRNFKAIEDNINELDTKYTSQLLKYQSEISEQMNETLSLYFKLLQDEAAHVIFPSHEIVTFNQNYYGTFKSNLVDLFDQVTMKTMQQIKQLEIFEKVNIRNLPQISNFFFSLLEQSISIQVAKLVRAEPDQREATQSHKFLILLSDVVAYYKQNMLKIIIEQVYGFLDKEPTISQQSFVELLCKKCYPYLQTSITLLKQYYVAHKKADITACLKQLLSQACDSQQQALLGKPENDADPINSEHALHIYTSCLIQQQKEFQFRIRYQIHDIMTSLTQIQSEVINYCPLLIDDIMKELMQEIWGNLLEELRLCKKMDLVHVRQLWLEVEFLQGLTKKSTNAASAKLAESIFQEFRRLAEGGKVFDEKSIQDVKEQVLKVARYKSYYNFKSFTAL